MVDTGSRIDPHPLRPASEGTHFKYLFLDQVLAYLDAHDHRLLAQELGIAPFLLYRWRKKFRQKGESGFPEMESGH
ncbi:MAG: transposase [Bacteroidota bacterium]